MLSERLEMQGPTWTIRPISPNIRCATVSGCTAGFVGRIWMLSSRVARSSCHRLSRGRRPSRYLVSLR